MGQLDPLRRRLDPDTLYDCRIEALVARLRTLFSLQSDVLLARPMEPLDPLLDPLALLRLLLEIRALLGDVHLSHLGGKVLLVDLIESDLLVAYGVDEVPRGVRVKVGRLAGGSLHARADPHLIRVRVLRGLALRIDDSQGPVGDVGLVDLDSQPRDLLVLGGRDVDDFPVLIDVQVVPVRQERAILPLRRETLAMGPAMDRVDDDSPGDRFLARAPVIDRALGERFVPGDEDELEIVVGVAPAQLTGSRLDDPAAVLLSAVGLQSEELLGDLVEVGREGDDPSEVAAVG